MLRTIHVGIDGSAASRAAVTLALAWAAKHGAKLLGHAPVAEPFITEAEAMPMGGAYFQGHRDEARLNDAKARAQIALDVFAKRCAEASVTATTVLEIGEPATLLHQRAETADLTMLGHQTYFHFDSNSDPDTALAAALHHPPRPVVVVPETAATGSKVMIAYDGSAEAARALMAAVACGLAENAVVVTVRETLAEAQTISQRAIDYLASHTVAATARAVASKHAVGEVLRTEVKDAGLLVMGAFSHSSLHQFFFGSTTKAVLHRLTVPVFLFH